MESTGGLFVSLTVMLALFSDGVQQTLTGEVLEVEVLFDNFVNVLDGAAWLQFDDLIALVALLVHFLVD